ncbi:44383_t:CDS:2, partial [Gigaspora margarita]
IGIFVGLGIQSLLTENEKHRYEDEIRAKDKMLLLMGNEIYRCDEKLKLIDDVSNTKNKMLLKYEKALNIAILLNDKCTDVSNIKDNMLLKYEKGLNDIEKLFK